MHACACCYGVCVCSGVFVWLLGSACLIYTVAMHACAVARGMLFSTTVARDACFMFFNGCYGDGAVFV